MRDYHLRMNTTTVSSSTKSDSATGSTAGVLATNADLRITDKEAAVISVLEMIANKAHRLEELRAEETRLAAEVDADRKAAQQQEQVQAKARIDGAIKSLPALFGVANIDEVLVILRQELNLPSLNGATLDSHGGIVTGGARPVAGKKSHHKMKGNGVAPLATIHRLRRTNIGKKNRRLTDGEYATIYTALKEPNPNVTRISRKGKVSRQTVYTIQKTPNLAKVRRGLRELGQSTGLAAR